MKDRELFKIITILIIIQQQKMTKKNKFYDIEPKNIALLTHNIDSNCIGTVIKTNCQNLKRQRIRLPLLFLVFEVKTI